MPAALVITTTTVRQLLGVRRMIVFGLAELAPAGVLLLMTQTLAQEAALDRFLGMVVALYFPLLVPIVTLIVAASALGDERRDGTLSFLVLRPIPRSAIALSKFGGAAIVAGGLNMFGAVALGVAYGVDSGSWDIVVPLVVGGALASVVYTSLFVPLGFFTDRAVLIGLAFVFIFENAVVSALSGLSALSPWRIGMSGFAGLAPVEVGAELADFGAVNLSSFNTAFFRTAVIAALSVAAITMVLRRRDLT
jgi:ABC-2 type transport system permease protein